MRSQRRSQSARQERRESGEKRNAAWRALSPADQLRDLDIRLGAGVGAKRQRAKLTDVVVSVQNVGTEPVVLVSKSKGRTKKSA